MFSRLSLLFLALSLAGCDQKTLTELKQARQAGEQREQQIENGRKAIPYAAQFRELYPQAWQDITKSYGRPAFYSEVGLHGRYSLQMKVPVQVGTDGVTVVSYDKPEFYLHEVESIEALGDGRIQINSAKDSARHLRFGPNEWERVVTAKGDCSVLGYSMVTNQPLPRFDETWNSKHERIKPF